MMDCKAIEYKLADGTPMRWYPIPGDMPPPLEQLPYEEQERIKKEAKQIIDEFPPVYFYKDGTLTTEENSLRLQMIIELMKHLEEQEEV